MGAALLKYMEPAVLERAAGRGLHSSTVRLSVSAFCELGGAFRGFLGGV